MPERRYDEREVAEIFQRAAESPLPTAPAATNVHGLTLPELQAIGRDVGIPAESIARAAHAVGTPGAIATRTFLGFPIGVSHTVSLGRPLSTEEWERLVVDLRETFDARGTVASHGSLRQWTNGALGAFVEPTTDGDRLRLRTTKTDARGMLGGGLAFMLVGLFLILAATVLRTTTDKGMLVAASTLAVWGAVMFGLSALRLPRWAATRRRQMEDVAARLAASDSANR